VPLLPLLPPALRRGLVASSFLDFFRRLVLLLGFFDAMVFPFVRIAL
jgi:hypothetical protein